MGEFGVRGDTGDLADTGDFGETGDLADTGDFGETGDFADTAVRGDAGVLAVFAVRGEAGVFAVAVDGAVNAFGAASCAPVVVTCSPATADAAMLCSVGSAELSWPANA